MDSADSQQEDAIDTAMPDLGEEEEEEAEGDDFLGQHDPGEVDDELEFQFELPPLPPLPQIQGEPPLDLEDEDFVEEEEEEEEKYEYTKHQMDEMKAAFKVYDKLKSDTILGVYLPNVLRSLGLNPSEGMLRSHRKWLDLDPKRGYVKFKEFLIIVGRSLKEPTNAQHALEGFRSLDDDLSGTVPVARLREVLCGNLGEMLYKGEFKLLLRYADPHKKGKVAYEKFIIKMEKGKDADGKEEKGNKKATGKGKKGKKKGKKVKKGKKRTIYSVASSYESILYADAS